MAGKIKCPSCEVENVSSRVTCIACKEPLYRGKGRAETRVEPKHETETRTEKELKAKVSAKTTPNKGPDPFVDKPKEAEEKAPGNAPGAPIQKGPALVGREATYKEVKRKQVIKRRRKRKPAPKEEEAFLLSGYDLIPVRVSLGIVKVQRKNLSGEAKALISLWNRNKRLMNIH